MRQLERPIQMDCVLQFDVYLSNIVKDEYGLDDYSDKKLRIIEDVIYTTHTSIIPENNEASYVLLPDKYKNVNLPGSYNMRGNKHTIMMQHPYLDFTTDNPHLVLNKVISVRIIEPELEKFAVANTNTLAWEITSGEKPITKLSIDDIIRLYHQTLHKGVIFD